VDAHRAADALAADDPDDEDESPGSGEVGLKAQVKEAIAKVERELIVRALGARHGNVTHTARDLKISRKSLQTKMKELGLREPKEE
jgi:DNA-binding NtrC family response regulator